jgi:hypothetical protein
MMGGLKSHSNPLCSPFIKEGIFSVDENPSLEKRGRGDLKWNGAEIMSLVSETGT